LQQVDKHENIGLRKCSFCRVCSKRAISIEQTPGAMLSRPIKIIKSVYVQSEFSSAVMTRQASRSGAENARLRVADASDCDLKALRSKRCVQLCRRLSTQLRATSYATAPCRKTSRA